MISSGDPRSRAFLRERLAGKRLLVTGATGFVGSNLVRSLVGLGAEVTALLRPAADRWRLQDLSSDIRVCEGDLGRLQVEDCAANLEPSKIEIVFHLGAAGVNQAMLSPGPVLETNVIGTVRMLELARRLDVRRFVNCGSCFEYGAGQDLSEADVSVPETLYGISKLSAWLLAGLFHRTRHLPVVCLRPFTAYGPFEARHRLIPQIVTRALREDDIDLTSGTQTRDFVFVDDLVEAFLRAAVVDGVEGKTFNICSGRATSVREVVRTVLHLTGSRSKPRFGALPDRDGEVYRLSGNPDQAQAKLGWSPRVSLEEGLGRTIEWFRQHVHRFAAYAHR